MDPQRTDQVDGGGQLGTCRNTCSLLLNALGNILGLLARNLEPEELERFILINLILAVHRCKAIAVVLHDAFQKG